MKSSPRHRRVLSAVVSLSLAWAAAGLGTVITAAPSSAKPIIGPNVRSPMFTGHRGVGCEYNISVRVTDHRAPVALLIVDDRGHVVERLHVRNERRPDDKRVVESDWIPKRPGMMRAVAIQNGVKRRTPLFPVTPAFNPGGSLCTGL